MRISEAIAWDPMGIHFQDSAEREDPESNPSIRTWSQPNSHPPTLSAPQSHVYRNAHSI